MCSWQRPEEKMKLERTIRSRAKVNFPVDAKQLNDSDNSWRELASSFCCDAEQNEEELTKELLELCSWHDGEKLPVISVCTASSSYGRPMFFDSYSSEDDDAFLSFIHAQKTAVSPSRVSCLTEEHSFSAPSNLEISSLCPDSLDSLRSPTGSVEPGIQPSICESKTTAKPIRFQSCRDSVQLRSNESIARMNSMERAFHGIIRNNSCRSEPSDVYPVVYAPVEESQTQKSSSFWNDVDFGI
ncbi:hypothetical protein AB6A40_000538 [Gnathostoma spinigerum]|uniref:Uncharacterized protein n=1 Tax=Gnathostoma spinigerum TaxID=75299 RepID=A0ABD6E2B4_9BILA